MEMQKILARLEARLKARKMSASAVSQKATGSPDTIRNWQRRAKKENNPGASTATLAPIAEALEVPLDWLLGNGPDDLDAYNADASVRAQIMETVEKLPASLRPVALKQLAALVPSSEQEPSAAPEPASDR